VDVGAPLVNRMARRRKRLSQSPLELVEQVKHLIHGGNVRRLKIFAEDGETKLEMPLTIGVIAGGAVALAAPWLAVPGVIAAMVRKCKSKWNARRRRRSCLSHPSSGRMWLRADPSAGASG
jgi:hypothetical protein